MRHSLTQTLAPSKATMLGPALMFKDLATGPLARQVARANLISGSPQTAFRFDTSRIAKIELLLVQNIHHKPLTGLKKFWRYNLPTLKFHNDEIDFVCTRYKLDSKQDIPSVVSRIRVHNRDGKTIPIECQNQDNSQILQLLVAATEAKPVHESEIRVFKATQ